MLKIDEQNIGIPGLHDIPWQLGPWTTSADQSIGPEVTAYLKPDEYILRDYVDRENGTTVDLFVAYFKSLQNSLWSALSQDLFAGIGLAGEFVENHRDPRAWTVRRNSGEPIHDGESQPTYPGSVLVPK